MRESISRVLAALAITTSLAMPSFAASQQELMTWFENGYRADAGDGVKQDDSVAFEWYLKAAEGGHVAAMRNLAGMYGSGRGTDEDQEQAARWFKAAAEGGDAQGQYAYGNWYVQDQGEKVEWLRKAALQGHKEAIALLGKMNIEVGTVKPPDAPLLPKLAAMCVQEQLNAAGYAVGTVDGDIGRRSIAAAQQFAEAHGLTDRVPALSADTAEEWCRGMALMDPNYAAFLTAAVERADVQTAAYGTAGDFRYDVASNVAADQLDLIMTGLARAQTYLEANLGGGVPQEVRQGVTVKIVATGRGNEEPGGGNGAATAFAEAMLRPFFDVRNAQWNQNTQGRGWSVRSDSMKTVAHEYAHIWHGHLGAISGVHQPLAGWINEGLAEYLGYRVMVDAGDMDWDDVRPFVLNGAMQDQLRTPLADVNVWPGHVGFVAIDWLVDESPNGIMSLRILGEEVGKGRSAGDAFRKAFGVDLGDFYAQFEVWRAEILKSPRKAYEVRPKLVLAG